MDKLKMSNQEWCKRFFEKPWKVIISFGVLLLVLLLVLLILCFLFLPLQIVVEPQKLDVSLSPGENITKTISIGAIGMGEVTFHTTEPIKNWVKFSPGRVHVKALRHYINVNFSNIPSDTSPGEYEGAIQIKRNNEVKAEIPVFIKIHKAILQIVDIEAPTKVNKSERFKITAKIKNMGNYDAFKVNVSANSTNRTRLTWAEGESGYEEIPIIHKNETISADWWFKASQIDWSTITITVNNTSKNRTFDTEIIPVEIVPK
jgi:hypothetical protein